MATLTLDEPAIARLKQAAGLTEIRDAHGNIIGTFSPIRLPLPSPTPEELAEYDRLASCEGGYPTLQVFQRWLSFATDPSDVARPQRHIKELQERERCAGG